jgi:hypothetical protein
MPEKKTVQRAKKAKKQGKAASTQAGAYVEEEIEHVRRGKHGAKSPQQAIAIGLSKARRSGVNIKPPKAGKSSAATRKRAQRDLKAGKSRASKKVSPKRSRATTKALKKEGRSSTSKRALSKHAKSVARSRSTKKSPAKRKTATKRSSR